MRGARDVERSARRDGASRATALREHLLARGMVCVDGMDHRVQQVLRAAAVPEELHNTWITDSTFQQPWMPRLLVLVARVLVLREGTPPAPAAAALRSIAADAELLAAWGAVVHSLPPAQRAAEGVEAVVHDLLRARRAALLRP